MLIRSIDPHHPQAGEITPRAAYDSRRALLRRMAAGAAGTALASWAARQALADTALYPAPGRLPALAGQRSAVSGALTMEKITAYQDASSYNNFYEFGTDKSDPARNSATLKPRPWTVQVDGLVHKPRRFDLDELLQLAPLEERIYRLRCVEGWCMVILGGFLAGRAASAGAAPGQRQICRIHHPGRQGGDARHRLARARLALCRRPAPG